MDSGYHNRFREKSKHLWFLLGGPPGLNQAVASGGGLGGQIPWRSAGLGHGGLEVPAKWRLEERFFSSVWSMPYMACNNGNK
ncbi:hypothetical protein CEXT_749981 [Caerostris extrusa]|uniref:Uncharacterized protein n=1 Tax=Caerostris extrusa TaxID=172846 RepID=A0AAV4XDZ0_CAEEX|nr:hypothetical protein CEXT_749981 [Caerostris extrusa]